MNAARNEIFRYLARAGRAWRRRALARRSLTALTAVAVLLSATLIVLPLVPSARGWLVLALLCLAATGLALSLAPLLHRRTAPEIARWLARSDERLGGALADAVEFADALTRTGRLPTGSVELAREHVRRTAERLETDDPDRHAHRAVPRTGWQRAAAAAAVAVVVLAVLPRSRTLLFMGLAPEDPDVVRYETVELSYSYPEYLGLQPRSEIGTGDVQAPVGTHVTVTVEADRPLEWARLEVEGGGAQDMEIEARRATGRLVVVDDRSYRIVLHGLHGADDPEPPRHAIRALRDQPPTVRLRSPSGDVVLDPDSELDLLYRVADDYGVAEAVLVLENEPGAVADSEERPAAEAGRRRTLRRFAPPALSRIGSGSFSPAQLGVESGGELWLRVVARDADAVSGPKWASSRRVHVSVRSEGEVRERLEDHQQVLAERLLEVLAGHLVSAPERVADLTELASAHRAFLTGLEDVVAVFPAVMESLHDGPEADVAAVLALEEMQSRLKDLTRRRRHRADVLVRTGPEERAREVLERLHPGEIEELERDVLFFDMWADRRSALRAADSADELLESLRRLVEALGEPGEDEPSEAERAAAQDAAAEAESELSRMSEMAQELARSLPDDLASPEEEMRRHGEAMQLLRDLQAAMQRGDTDSARFLARQLQQLGGSLASSLQDMAGRGAMGDPELVREMQEMQRELGRLQQRQADLRDRTNQLRDEASRNLSEEDRQRVDELFQELLALTDEAIELHEKGDAEMAEARAVRRFFDRLDQQATLQQGIRDIAERARTEGRLPSRAEQLEQERLRDRLSQLVLEDLGRGHDVESLMRRSEQAREHLVRLRQTLAERDLPGAWRPARHALGMLGLLVSDLVREDDPDLAERAAPYRSAQVRTSEVLERLEDLERQVRQASDRALTGAQRQELNALGGAQDELARMARELARRLREAGVDAPFLDREVGEAVGEAARHMGEARGDLEAERPSAASEMQGEALARLEEAGESLSPEDAARRSGSQRGRRDGRRGLFRREDVEIPDADAYDVPAEFREEILAAMRESPAPRGYEEQVREYYRRLVE